MAEPILTIGHSNHPLDEFLGLLERHAVRTLADVRSMPASRFNPQFNRKALEAALASRGIAYEFLGAGLGARTDDSSCYEHGRVSYRRLAATAAFRRDIERLVAIAARSRTAIMCAEHEPLDCHRTILVARELVRAGVPVAHILRDGTLESAERADERLVERCMRGEIDLFARDSDRRELVELAYERQGARIAYAPHATRARAR